MPEPDPFKPSFSSGRRWVGAFNTGLAAAAALALVVMLNYLAAGHALRFQWSRDASFKLSRQTKNVLESLTNDVQVTIFFQPDGNYQEIYGLTRALLTEYQNANPHHIKLSTLDYTRFPGPAKELLTKLDLTGPREKDFVVFESNGHHKIVYATELSEYDYSDLMARRSKYVRRNAFRGEMLFTSYIYDVSNPQVIKTYFLYGHGENDPGKPTGDSDNLGDAGYSKLAAILKEECDSAWDRLSLLGSNDIPHDCQLLIVAGPRQGDFLPGEVEKITAYLKNGGRLLALLTKPCGLEPMLAKQWGVRLGNSRVVDKDPNFSISPYTFRTAQLSAHLIVDVLIKDETPIVMVWPRPLSPTEDQSKIPGAPIVTILAATSPSGVDEKNIKQSYPLLAAVEQGIIKGVDTVRGGGTRIVVAGDSDFLDDLVIKYEGNHLFAKLALSWLLQRPAIMVEGLGPQPIKEYRISLTPAKSSAIRWLFLAAMPASILALGGLVWLRRRR